MKLIFLSGKTFFAKQNVLHQFAVETSVIPLFSFHLLAISPIPPTLEGPITGVGTTL